MTNSLDSLANLVAATGYSSAEIAAKVGVDTKTVQAWIGGTARPDAATAQELRAFLRDLRHRLNQNRRVSSARDQALASLSVALQNPEQRAAWLASRAEMRRQFAGR